MESDPSQKTLAQLEQENRRLRRAVEELSILNAIGTAASSTMSVNAIVELIVQESVRQLKVEQGSVMLLQDETDNDPFRTMARKAHSGSGRRPLSLWAATDRVDAKAPEAPTHQ